MRDCPHGNSLGWIILTALASGFGGYFGAYLRKKGENLATHEDLDKVVRQMEATTTATKAIEARISDEMWDRQKRWELRRDTVIGVIQAMIETREGLMKYFATREVAKETDAPKAVETYHQSMEEWHIKSTDFDSRRVVALMIWSKQLNDILWEARQRLRVAFSDLAHGRVASYDEVGALVKEATERAIAAARNELGTDGV